MDPTRRDFLRMIGGSLAYASLGAWSFAAAGGNKPLNVLLFTADDLHCESVGCFRGKPSGLTPNLDKFASEGMRFDRAHVNAAICMPSRTILGTGLYGHNSGGMGFKHARGGTPNVISIFKKSGYLTGILGKVEHSTPVKSEKWDYCFDRPQLGDGRSPKIYYQRCKDFFDKCKQEKKPFYFMVNSHDPHRPFHAAGRTSKGSEEPSKTYKPSDVTVPGFLSDLGGVRKEFATYLNSTRRCDDTFGKTMQALKESGYDKNTLVMFLSDNGIAMPFAKANCYLASTLTPWIVRWPGVVKPGRVDNTHFISGVDFLPTILEAAGIQKPAKQDGFSFVPLLKGQTQDGRDEVFTQIDYKISGPAVPMRCVQNERYGYIFNAWSDGKFEYSNNNEGLTMKAMEKRAPKDPKVAERVKMYRIRVPEEFYDLKNDPDCLNNLMDDPKVAKERDALLSSMKAWMVKTRDPLLPAFEKRGDPAAMKAALKSFGRGAGPKRRKKGKKGKRGRKGKGKA